LRDGSSIDRCWRCCQFWKQTRVTIQAPPVDGFHAIPSRGLVRQRKSAFLKLWPQLLEALKGQVEMFCNQFLGHVTAFRDGTGAGHSGFPSALSNLVPADGREVGTPQRAPRTTLCDKPNRNPNDARSAAV